MFSSFCSRPRSPGPFMRKRPPEAQTELSTNCTVVRCGLLVVLGQMASGSVHLKGLSAGPSGRGKRK
jgi:hypothetical protein